MTMFKIIKKNDRFYVRTHYFGNNIGDDITDMLIYKVESDKPYIKYNRDIIELEPQMITELRRLQVA